MGWLRLEGVPSINWVLKTGPSVHLFIYSFTLPSVYHQYQHRQFNSLPLLQPSMGTLISFPLTRLPEELILLIFEKVERRADLINFALASKQLKRIANPCLLRHDLSRGQRFSQFGMKPDIHFLINETRLQPYVQQLSAHGPWNKRWWDTALYCSFVTMCDAVSRFPNIKHFLYKCEDYYVGYWYPNPDMVKSLVTLYGQSLDELFLGEHEVDMFRDPFQINWNRSLTRLRYPKASFSEIRHSAAAKGTLLHPVIMVIAKEPPTTTMHTRKQAR